MKSNGLTAVLGYNEGGCAKQSKVKKIQ